MNVSIPIILTISLLLLLNTGSANIYGQIAGQTNQTNQTSGQNTTQQAQQQLDQANQQMQQANQTQQQANQTQQQQQANQTQQQQQANQTQQQQATTQKTQQQQQANQTQQQQQANQSKQQDPELGEKLLNYTNAAILALNDDDIDVAQDNLVQIQNALINASGKQVVVVPAPAVPSDEEGSEGSD